MSDRVLLLGCGVMGGQVLDFLIRSYHAPEVRVLARREGGLAERVNLAIAAAHSGGYAPRVTHAALDVHDVERLAWEIVRWRPAIIVNTTTDQTSWTLDELPEPVRARLREARPGPWLPHHLAPARCVMTAVRLADCSAPVVNVAFPDAVNAVLGRRRLAPLVGAGNVGSVVPTLRRAVALQLGVEPAEVEITLVAHHAVSSRLATHGTVEGLPYGFAARVNARDVTPEVDRAALFSLFTGPLRSTGGLPGQVVAASCTAFIVRALRESRPVRTHAPGPLGLVGGYPVLLGRGVLRLALPPGLCEAEAIRMNEEAQRADGIDRIEADGTIHFAPAQMRVMKEVLGYDRPTVRWDEVEDGSRELSAKYRELKSSLAMGGSGPWPRNQA